jgi:hypothetical protein
MYIHSRLSQQLLKAHAAIRKLEQAFGKGILEEISQLASDFLEASKNFILDLCHGSCFFGYTAENSHHLKARLT